MAGLAAFQPASDSEHGEESELDDGLESMGSDDEENEQWLFASMRPSEGFGEQAVGSGGAHVDEDGVHPAHAEDGGRSELPSQRNSGVVQDANLQRLREIVCAKNRLLREALLRTQRCIKEAAEAAETKLGSAINHSNCVRDRSQQMRKDRELRGNLRSMSGSVSACLLDTDFFFQARPPMDERGQSLQEKVIAHRPKAWTKQDRTRLVASVKTTCSKVLSGKAREQLPYQEYMKENSRIKGLSDKELFKEIDPVQQDEDFWMKVAMGVKRTKEECKLQWLHTDSPLLCTDPWTKAEERKLHTIAPAQKFTNWVKIAQELGTNRSPVDVLQHFQQVFNSTLCRTGPWTEEEDASLRKAVQQHGSANWVEVARSLQALGLPRSPQQCLHRWRALDPQLRKGPWTPEEDAQLHAALHQLCPDHREWVGDAKALAKRIPWAQVSKLVPGRSGPQVRERWVYILKPANDKGGGPVARKRKLWTDAEQALLESAVALHGYGKWTAIAEMVPGRSDAQCKKRWDIVHPVEASEAFKRKRVVDAVIPHVRKDLWRRPKRKKPALQLEDFEVGEEVWADAESKVNKAMGKRLAKKYAASEELEDAGAEGAESAGRAGGAAASGGGDVLVVSDDVSVSAFPVQIATVTEHPQETGAGTAQAPTETPVPEASGGGMEASGGEEGARASGEGGASETVGPTSVLAVPVMPHQPSPT